MADLLQLSGSATKTANISVVVFMCATFIVVDLAAACA
jgi:hypothetical protein